MTSKLKDDLYYFSAYMYYFDNPGGMIPTWLINWAAKVRLYVNYSLLCVILWQTMCLYLGAQAYIFTG